VQDGEFDRMLVRPHDTLFQTITQPGQIFPDELVLALTFFIFATWLCGVHVGVLFVVMVPLIILGGALIDLAISLAIATLAFWFVRVDALRWLVLQLEQEFTRYPISIYSRGVRLMLAFVFPFAFMNYFPAAFFLNKTDNGLALPAAVGLLTPLIGIIAAGLAYMFWRFGLNRYQGVGH
jgi:ABC-2 type transport system permease protein